MTNLASLREQKELRYASWLAGAGPDVRHDLELRRPDPRQGLAEEPFGSPALWLRAAPRRRAP
ncbi:MAG: hypothetical protein ACLSAH_07545 [Bilophila wadsworthia]